MYGTSTTGTMRYPRRLEIPVEGCSTMCCASTRNFLTFVNTTAIAYGQKIAQSLKILVLCNSSRVYKRQEITSTVVSSAILGLTSVYPCFLGTEMIGRLYRIHKLNPRFAR